MKRLIDNRTTIQIDKDLRKRLKRLKKFKNETYSEQIERMIKKVKVKGVK